ncbi:hypothetical protein E7Z59_09510 [Robertkochia marina]|uniref:Uncharacterized protein n=1 Tax=Robertkochia marina TaxID=1227945 RepID=A0A4V3UY65_9FLAO|nr:hypothetical protein [Robertkochia marina]THD67876.1 hypothetical protein E7Z59_09510 [Robertkochia marina]TRZ42085.1 hypothetical protein D3A96_12205 [Robertkochia marina]
MKLKLFLFLLPFLAATLCTDEEELISPDPESRYQLQNNTTTDLYLLTDNGFLEIPAQATTVVGSEYNSTDGKMISPSETILFQNLKLYRLENGDYMLVYEQDPVDDALWNFEEDENADYRLFEYTLVISETLFN